MREISELIYETCKTYLNTQGKFILLFEVFMGVSIVLYFGFLLHFEASRVFIILVVREPAVQIQLLVWIFNIRVVMIVAAVPPT